MITKISGFCFILGITGIIISAGCSSVSNQNQNTKTTQDSISASTIKAKPQTFETFKKGVLINPIKCKSDTNISYALYIPSTHSFTPSLLHSKASPALFFFDPHASGALPIKKYQFIADKYGFILAGSNNSKNGNSGEVNGAFGSAMIDDVLARLNIDRKKVYTCGFSGGSRMASYVAIYKGGINTVIGCSAGLPGIDKPIENTFNYIGIAGDEDFNCNEMIELEKTLTSSDIEHIFIPFNGKHEWCPPETMEKAIKWILFKAMKAGEIPKNDTLINTYLADEKTTIDELLKNKNEMQALNEAKQALNFLSGLKADDKLNTLVTQLEQSGAVKKAKQRIEELSNAEKTLKEQYLNAMALKDASWWKTETIKLNDINKFPKDQLVMNKRILSYLSLACYMNIQHLMNAKQPAEAAYYLSIYKVIDPENPEIPSLQAAIDLTGNKKQK